MLRPHADHLRTGSLNVDIEEQVWVIAPTEPLNFKHVRDIRVPNLDMLCAGALGRMFVPGLGPAVRMS